jgi:hypothetical protein
MEDFALVAAALAATGAARRAAPSSKGDGGPSAWRLARPTYGVRE